MRCSELTGGLVLATFIVPAHRCYRISGAGIDIIGAAFIGVHCVFHYSPTSTLL